MNAAGRGSASIDDATAERFRRDGVVHLQGVFAGWVDVLRAGVERNMQSPGPYTKEYEPEGSKGYFFGDYCNWARIPEYRDFVHRSHAAELAARLMNSTTARFFHEHVLVKEPHTESRTPCTMISPTTASTDTDRELLDPARCGAALDMPGAGGGIPLLGQVIPAEEVRRHRLRAHGRGARRHAGHRRAPRRVRDRVVRHGAGDAIAFHFLTVHGAPETHPSRRDAEPSPTGGSATTSGSRSEAARSHPRSRKRIGACATATRSTIRSSRSCGGRRTEPAIVRPIRVPYRKLTATGRHSCSFPSPSPGTVRTVVRAGLHRPSHSLARYTRARTERPREPSHADVPGAPQGTGPHHPPLRSLLRHGLRRPRRRRGQGREPRRRGRHAPHAAVRGRRERAVHAVEPEQAIGGARPQVVRGSGHLQVDGRDRGRRHRELQAGHRQAARNRLRGPVRSQSSADLLLHLGIRPDRPVFLPRRVRPHRLGHVRADEHQRARGRPAVPHSDSDHRPRGRLNGAVGILAALAARERTGSASTSTPRCSKPDSRWGCTRRPESSPPARCPSVSGRDTGQRPVPTLSTADGYINIGCANDRFWDLTCEVLGCPHLTTEPRFATKPERVRNIAALVEALTPYFERETTAHCARSSTRPGCRRDR